MQHRHDASSSRSAIGRRRFLATSGVALAGAGLAGCLDVFGGRTDPFDDYGPQGEALDSGEATWDDLGDLEGELVVYSGRTRDQIKPLFDELEDQYPEFEITADYDGNDAQLASLREEGDATDADVFYTQDSGALAAFKEEGLARELPDDVTGTIEERYRDRDGRWTGASGRVRAVLYNTDAFDGDELPDDIFAYAEDDRFAGRISTRPNSGSFRAFIVAMMELEGEERTREWATKMVEEQEIVTYDSGTQQAEAVAAGDQDIALGNQYYAGRILQNAPDAPLGVAFTREDPGCLFNVSGIAVHEHAEVPNLAAEFVRHVLAREGQEFFVAVNGEYPVVDHVEYVGDLPALADIRPPEFDLNTLGLELQEARDLQSETGLTL
ncbi:extracellular solute-binding protein [Halovivax gelatinilyticus]|uniref:extracellular solute-binding protein n=1 Tax=Halovivax gelatinilyticus TaxID=2961597 RepID=UPI0020CA2DF7|nr:extracellular solute-binding protein [Halovivax gelatinilyticus]